MVSIAVSMLRHALTVLKVLIVLVELSTHALLAVIVLQVQAHNRLALQERFAIHTIKIGNYSALQAPIAQPAQDRPLLLHQQMQTISMFRERQLIPKTNVAMVTSARVAPQGPMTRPAP
jgi:hypothetical protein